MRRFDHGITILLLYVDDMIITGDEISRSINVIFNGDNFAQWS